MSDFVNTVDIIGDDALIDSLIDRSISGSFNDDKITQIGAYAFSGCTNLESVSFPNATTCNQNENFTGCTSLTDVNLPVITSCPIFKNCTSLKNITLPMAQNGGLYLFEGCTSLETITVPLLKNIGWYNFRGCTSLRKIDLPSCTSLDDYGTFDSCPLDALILRSTTMCTLGKYGADWYIALQNTSIANGTGYIYVPAALIDSYKTATNWSTYAAQFRALEDYTVDGTITGKLDETKI